MSPKSAAKFLVLLSLLPTCTSRAPDAGDAPAPAQESREAETERAFEQERLADLVVWYYSPEEIVLRAGQQQVDLGSEGTFISVLARLDCGRRSAVVVMMKPTRVWPEDQFRAKVDELERLLRARGFQRVIFQLASAMGRPIYRE
jgi:hypothetical protein